MNVISFVQNDDKGQRVRWFAADGNHREQLATTSRDRVEFHRDDIPAAVFDAAHAAHRELRRDRNADLRHYATNAEPKDGE